MSIRRNSIKTTEELTNEIKYAVDINRFKQDNKKEFLDISLSEYLTQLLVKHNVDKSGVFKHAQMTESTYGYEIFNGKKSNVSRDKLIRICFGFPLTCEEADEVLLLGKMRPLYPRDKRDALIMYALNNKYTIDKVNDLLFENKEKIID